MLVGARALALKPTPFCRAHTPCKKPVLTTDDHVRGQLCRSCTALRREPDRGFECVATGFAFPQVPHAARIDEFRPFRHEQVLTALRAFNRPARTRMFERK